MAVSVAADGPRDERRAARPAGVLPAAARAPLGEVAARARGRAARVQLHAHDGVQVQPARLARRAAVQVLEVRLTDQLLMLDTMLGDCETSEGRVAVKAVVAELRGLGARLVRISSRR